MFALKSGQGRTAGAGRQSGFGFFADHSVLPRWLRRPARMFSRLADGEVATPPFAATIASALLLGATGLYGAYVGGHMPALVQGLTARTGFAVDEVRMFGHRETSEIDILEKLEFDGWTSLIGFDADQARARVATLPWVETVAVRKVYPNSLEVRIEEREPFAIWQHGAQLQIVGREGNVITPFTGGRHAALPLVTGYGAVDNAVAFVEKVGRHPELAARVKGYVRVSERRWNLRLENGVTVKLPEAGQDAALADLLRMDRESGLLSRDIAAIDMRLADRLVVELTPEAETKRNVALGDLYKASKGKAGKKI